MKAIIFFKVIFQLLIAGLGDFILKTFRPKRAPGELSSVVVGLIVWGVIIWAGWTAYGNLRAVA